MSAAWRVGFAQNLKALTPGSAWSRQTASPTIHYGGVCESGVTEPKSWGQTLGV